MRQALDRLSRAGLAIDAWYGDGCPEWDAHDVLRYVQRELSAGHLLPDVQLHIHEFFRDPPERSKPMVDWVRERILAACSALLSPEVTS